MSVEESEKEVRNIIAEIFGDSEVRPHEPKTKILSASNAGKLVLLKNDESCIGEDEFETGLILRKPDVTKAEVDELSSNAKHTDVTDNNVIHRHEADTQNRYPDRTVNHIMVKLVFAGLLFLLIFVCLAYLFASNSAVFSSELPKHISLLVVGILAMIAWVGYGWIGRN